MINTRPAIVEERRLIVSKWLDEYKRVPSAGTIPGNLFLTAYLPVLYSIMDHKDVSTTVATHAAAPDVVLGFAVTEVGFTRPVLHFCFVKDDYRKNGIATRLLKDAGINPKEPFFYTYETEYTRKSLRDSPRWIGTYNRNIVVIKKDINFLSLSSKRATRRREHEERVGGGPRRGPSDGLPPRGRTRTH